MRANQPGGGISFAFYIAARGNAAQIRHKTMFPAETFDTFETGTDRMEIELVLVMLPKKILL
jgi:hypothetical protein